ncbi:hypothetical protein [Luteimonas vadosa]|uniref:Uncharacterized protein n=1 Tax=Luteimonas vadosa TaxID=1165507 RepID=A0ABP9DSI0_9GAMM
MRALFVGGTVDNSELDLEGNQPPRHYPPDTGTGQARYRLHAVGHQDQAVVYAVYGAPGMAEDEIRRIADERDYARRFAATEVRAAND